MAGTGICDLTIEDLSKGIAGGDLSPVEVTDAHLARIDALNPVLNAFTTVARGRARAEAKAAEDEIAAGGRPHHAGLRFFQPQRAGGGRGMRPAAP